MVAVEGTSGGAVVHYISLSILCHVCQTACQLRFFQFFHTFFTSLHAITNVIENGKENVFTLNIVAQVY